MVKGKGRARGFSRCHGLCRGSFRGPRRCRRPFPPRKPRKPRGSSQVVNQKGPCPDWTVGLIPCTWWPGGSYSRTLQSKGGRGPPPGLPAILLRLYPSKGLLVLNPAPLNEGLNRLHRNPQSAVYFASLQIALPNPSVNRANMHVQMLRNPRRSQPTFSHPGNRWWTKPRSAAIFFRHVLNYIPKVPYYVLLMNYGS